MKGILAMLTALALWLSAAPAAAQFLTIGDYEFSLVETLYGDWHWDNKNHKSIDDEFLSLKNRFNLMVQSREIQLGVRIDSAYFQTFSSDSDMQKAFDVQYQNDLWPINAEKIYARVKRRGYSIDAGDFYACMGKGIALCVKKLDELSLDTTIRGAKAVYRSRLIQATALGGFSNIVNVGQKLENKLEDPWDLIMGLEGKLTPAKWLKVSTHASFIKDREKDDQIMDGDFMGRRYLATFGATLQVPDISDMFSFYVEGDLALNKVVDSEGFGSKKEIVMIEDVGKAVYANATFRKGIVHVLAEFKYYDGFAHTDGDEGNIGYDPNKFAGKEIEYEDHDKESALGNKVPSSQSELVYYGVLPTLEDETLFEQPQFYDVIGGRMRVDVELQRSPDTTVFSVIYSHFEDLEEFEIAGDDTDKHVRHARGILEKRVDSWNLVGNLQGGYRWDKLYPEYDRRMWHVGGDVQFPIKGKHGLEIQGRHENYLSDFELEADFMISRASMTYSWAPRLMLTATYEHSNKVDPTTDLEHFVNGEVLYRFTSDSYLKIMVGSSRGGLICASGVCRTFPSFVGMRGELTLRF